MTLGFLSHCSVRVKNYKLLLMVTKAFSSIVGTPIDQLAMQNRISLEVCYLLLHWLNCRRAHQYNEFCKSINRHTMVHEQMRNFFNGFRRDAHPMAIAVGVVGALYWLSITTR